MSLTQWIIITHSFSLNVSQVIGDYNSYKV